MPGPTQDKQAAALANEIIAMCQSVQAIAQRVQPLMDQWGAVDTYAKLQAFPTCATNPDGSIGAADPAPVGTNVFDPRSPPSDLVSMAISSGDVAGLATFLVNGVKAAAAGEAVTADPNVPVLLAKVM
jgi:hypothetical protein